MELLKENLFRKHRSSDRKSCALPDYHCDNRSFSEKILAAAISFGVVCLLVYFFYRSIWAMVPLMAVGYLFYRGLTKRSIAKQIDCLEKQFRECIMSVSSMLKAGYAVENAFCESKKDMVLIYGNKSMIVNELEIIRRGLVMNTPLEELLESMAVRSGSTHIEQFAQVFSIAKKSGGNLGEIMRSSSELIGKDIEARQEIRAVLSGRRMEQNIMKMMPFAIIFYVGLTSRGYFDSLYGNVTGIAIMTGCLVVYMFAYWFGDRILDKIEREC